MALVYSGPGQQYDTATGQTIKAGGITSGAAGTPVNIPSLQQGLVDYSTAAHNNLVTSHNALEQLMPGYSSAVNQATGVLSQYLGGGLSAGDQQFLNTRAAAGNVAGGRVGGIGNTAATLLNFNQIQARQQFAVQALPTLQNAMTNWNQQYAMTPGQYIGAQQAQTGLALQAQQMQNAYAQQQENLRIQSEQQRATAAYQTGTLGIEAQKNQLAQEQMNLSNALAYAGLNQQWAENMLSIDWARETRAYNEHIADKYANTGLQAVSDKNAASNALFNPSNSPQTPSFTQGPAGGQPANASNVMSTLHPFLGNLGNLNPSTTQFTPQDISTDMNPTSNWTSDDEAFWQSLSLEE